MTLEELYNVISQIGPDLRNNMIVTVHSNKHKSSPVTDFDINWNKKTKEFKLFKKGEIEYNIE